MTEHAAEEFLDDFFASYHRHRPVNATFIGVHEYDARLPDFSDHGLGDLLADTRTLLQQVEALGDVGNDPVLATDLRLARGFLRLQLWEQASAHFRRGNPSTAVGEAIFGVMSLFLTDYGPLGARMDAAVERMEWTPDLLDHARRRIEGAPAAWTRRALAECRGAMAFLGDGIDLLAAQDPSRAPRLRAAADRATAAFGDFATWLGTDLLPAATGDVACGEEAFSLYLREGHFIDLSADDLASWAQDELSRARAALQRHAGDLGAASPEKALAGLNRLHPSADDYYDAYGRCWDEMRAAAQEAELVTWPDDPLRFVPRPDWSRGAAPDLYFLFYRSPAAHERPTVHEHLVAPLEDGWSEEETEAFLQANNDSVIKLNHVVHHAGIGHHVQNGHAFRGPSRIGRMAAVDCASRIAMFCGGTMAEGWACYATDLMGEVDAFTPLEAYSELRSRTRMCARAVVDVELHHGRMTLEEAAGFYRQQAGMSPGAALAEATKNSMFPGAAVMYLVGRDHIHALRRAAERREGSAFRLRDFHDRLLSRGSIPVTLAGDLMGLADIVDGPVTVATPDPLP